MRNLCKECKHQGQTESACYCSVCNGRNGYEAKTCPNNSTIRCEAGFACDGCEHYRVKLTEKSDGVKGHLGFVVGAGSAGLSGLSAMIGRIRKETEYKKMVTEDLYERLGGEYTDEAVVAMVEALVQLQYPKIGGIL